MKLVLVSESATGRPNQRARALRAATEGTRVRLLCAEMTAHRMRPTRAGRRIGQLMDAMQLGRLAEGSTFYPLRDATDLEALAAAIRAQGAMYNSLPHPTDPQATSLVIVANAQLIAHLAEQFGAEFDPAAVLPAVIDLDIKAELAELSAG